MEMKWENLISKTRQTENIASDFQETYPRSEFEYDYHNIVNSASLRRLQDKTQVFPLDKSDFVRTRLTHSLETSSFAKTLGEAVAKYLRNRKWKDLSQDQIDDIINILSCSGLLHDIGNPPFGHFGEVAIRDWFKSNLNKIEFCGQPIGEVLNEQMCEDLRNFEGNAQALRILTKLHFIKDKHGMNLTYGILNTLIKYPTSSMNIGKNSDIRYKKMGYFYSEKEIFGTITKDTGSNDKRHPLTFLLEAADDIAYGTGDIEDGFKKGLFSFDELVIATKEFQIKYKDKMDNAQSTYTKELFDELKLIYNEAVTVESIKNPELYAVQNWIKYAQDWLMYCAVYGFTYNYENIIRGTYCNELLDNTFHHYSMEILKDIATKYVYPSASILKLEIAAHKIIHSLLNKFVSAVLYDDKEFKVEGSRYKMNSLDKKLSNLISDNYRQAYNEYSDGKDRNEKLYLRLLLVTDYISGMTDSYAKSLYQELNGI